MRRAFLSSALLVGGLFVAACTEQRSPLPTQAPSLDVSSSTRCDPTVATQIDIQIIALFPNKPSLRGAASSQFTNIKRKCPTQIQVARDMTVDLAGFASKKYQSGQLTSGAQAVSDFIDVLYQYVELDAPHISPDALGTSGGVAVIGSGGGQFRTGEGLAGLLVPPGSVSSDHLFVITRQDEAARTNTCLTTTLAQFPLCYDYAVFPGTTFNPPVTLVICQLESNHPAGLALAHAVLGGNGIEILPAEGDPLTPPLDCTGAILAASKGLFNRLQAFALKLITPKALYAGHSGLGGSTCCFSNFIAVRPLIRVSGFTSERNRAPLLDPQGSAPEGDFGTTNIVNDLRDLSKFGPTGTVRCSVDFRPFVTSVETGSLVDEMGQVRVGVFFAGLTATTLTSGEADELARFLRAGGILYISGNTLDNEGPSYNPLFTALDVADHYSDETVSTGNSVQSSDPPDNTPFTNGPFGTVGPLMHTPFRIITPSATTGLATGFNTEAVILAEGGFGSGRLSMTGDPLYFNFFTGTNDLDNQTYFLNLFAFGCR